MRRLSGRRRLTCLAFLAILLAGCGSGDSTAPPTADLSGSYTLQSLTLGGFTFTPPVAAGTLVLTASSYTLNASVSVPGQPPQSLADNGTYSLSGATWTQKSAVTGQTTVGTYSRQGHTLTVNVTLQGQPSTTAWLKQ